MGPTVVTLGISRSRVPWGRSDLGGFMGRALSLLHISQGISGQIFWDPLLAGRSAEMFGELLNDLDVRFVRYSGRRFDAGVPPASFFVNGSQGPPCDPHITPTYVLGAWGAHHA